MKLKGQIPIWVAIIGAGGMIVASVFTSWTTASSNLAEVRTEVKIVEERENNHYAEVQKQLEQVNKILLAAPWAKTVK